MAHREILSLKKMTGIRTDGDTIVIGGVHHNGSRSIYDIDMVLKDMPGKLFFQLAGLCSSREGQRVVEVVFQELADEPKLDDAGNLIIQSLVMFNRGGELITLKIQNGEALMHKLSALRTEILHARADATSKD